MCEASLSRRQLLRYAALVGATFPALKAFGDDFSTLDEFGRPLPVAAPGRVLIGSSPDVRAWREVGAHGAPPYHYVVIKNLKPGTTSHWRAESNGVPAVATVVTRTDLTTVTPRDAERTTRPAQPGG